jgi:CRISPR-associated protein Csm3
MKLKEISTISGRIILESGLHIGAGDTEMHIGGTDNPVVKHPHSNEPYIPGSSIKGKVRALLELKSGLMAHTDGKPVRAAILGKKVLNDQEKKEAEMILKLFGSSGADKEEIAQIGPSRLSFSDCPLSENSREKVKKNNLPFTEVKSENSINRIKGTAENPRFTERVVAGMGFDFGITVKEMEEDSGLVEYLLTGLKMLSMDALGGSGSRGYGRVRFEFDDNDIQQKFDTALI